MAMSKKEMLDYIWDRLEEAPDRDVEAVYWLVVMDLDG